MSRCRDCGSNMCVCGECEECEELREECENLREEYRKLAEKVEAVVEALEFYTVDQSDVADSLTDDNGVTACEAIKLFKEGKPE